MRKFLTSYSARSTLLFVALSIVAACECLECGQPLEKEPFVIIRFFTKTDLAAAPIAISEFNGVDATEYSYFQDTTNEYLLPLSMQEDQSEIILQYAPVSDFNNVLTDTLFIGYERNFEVTIKNYVQMVGLRTEILNHTLDSLSFTCQDSLGICNSNESTIRAFF